MNIEDTNEDYKLTGSELYFYEIGAYGYEEVIEKQYYSKNRYNQEEFEAIVFYAMEKLMNQILNDEPTSVCFHNIFYQCDDLILHEDFDKLMEDGELYRLSNKLSGSVSFELDNRSPNKYNTRLDNLFLKLPVDESCKKNNCSRIIDEDDTEKEYLKKQCGVSLREKLRKIK